jgi:hypothetical protein
MAGQEIHPGTIPFESDISCKLPVSTLGDFGLGLRWCSPDGGRGVLKTSVLLNLRFVEN